MWPKFNKWITNRKTCLETTTNVLEKSHLFEGEVKIQLTASSEPIMQQHQRAEMMRKNIGRLKSKLSKEN